MEHVGSENDVQRFFLHYPEDNCPYICIVDSKMRPFDFSDNTFKLGRELTRMRDACVYATGRREDRADHGYSYTVEVELARLLTGKDPETVPSEGSVVSVHWLVQVGGEPDVKVDRQLDNTRFRLTSGAFEPADTSSRDDLDEKLAFAKRVKEEEEYSKFISWEIEWQGSRRERLRDAVRNGDVSVVLRVLADDLCFWGGNLRTHLLHQVTHLAKDPFFVRMRDVPKDAPFRVHEIWIERDWIGSHEAFDLLEFHKSPEYAQSFSTRFAKLHEARTAFGVVLNEYTVQTRGEDVEGVFALDEMRKDLKHHAIQLAGHLDLIATQFEAARRDEPKMPASDPATSEQYSSPNPRLFSGGEVVFFEDRVEFCGVDICSGPRSSSKRIILELLSRKRDDGTFVGYSGSELEDHLRERGVQGSAAGSIRDLRDDVTASLRGQAGIICERKDVIQSGGPGYRFAESVTVRYANASAITDIADIDESEDAPNVPDSDVRNAFDVLDNAAARREWILQQLAEGVELKAPNVANQFKCSVKTAQRDLTALKDEGKIEYVGAPRTGYYQLCPPPKTDR